MTSIMHHEPFSDWLEEKTDLPIFEEFPILTNYEFDSVCESFVHHSNTLHSTDLTPPQSPPQVDYQLDSSVMYVDQPQNPFANVYLESVNTPAYNAEELAAVDDFVLNTARNIQWEIKDQTIPPLTNIENSEKSDVCTEQVPTTVQIDSLTELEPVKPYIAPADLAYVYTSSNYNTPQPSSPSSSSSIDGSSENDEDWPSVSSKSSLRSHSKPYSRNNEEKKSRKKEQNKNAATRYRQKKKAEIEILMEEEKELRVKNDELNNKYTELCREIKYLKKLARDVLKVKTTGILPKV